MRDIIIKASMIAGAALLVTACGETATNNTAANTMGGEYNTMDSMGNMGTTDMNAMGNMSTDTNTTTNMMMNDLSSNDADTNLANGM